MWINLWKKKSYFEKVIFEYLVIKSRLFCSIFTHYKLKKTRPFGPRKSSCSEKNARNKRNGNLSFLQEATFSNLLFLPQLTHNNDEEDDFSIYVAKKKLSLLLPAQKKVEQEEMAKVKVVRKFGGSWNMSLTIIFPSYLINWFFSDSK